MKRTPGRNVRLKKSPQKFSRDVFPGSDKTRLKITEILMRDAYICRTSKSRVILDENYVRAYVRKCEKAYELIPGLKIILMKEQKKKNELFLSVFRILKVTKVDESGETGYDVFDVILASQNSDKFYPSESSYAKDLSRLEAAE